MTTTIIKPSIAPERLKEIRVLLDTAGFRDAELYPLAGDASFRRYVRVRKGNQAAMLMDAPPEKEDVRPFVANADYLYQQGFSAPAILARNIESGLLLLEDLGDDSFTSVLKANPALETELYAAAIDVLAHWHDRAVEFSNPSALPLGAYDRALLVREISLFPDWFLPQVAGKERAAALKPEYMALWEEIFAQAPLDQSAWVHRDYHADNLMWLPAREYKQRVGLLDFQDSVYGDAAYDLVSLLEDARRDVPPPVVEAMIKRYIETSGIDAQKLKLAYAVLGAQRNSKIIGIFARLAVRDGKAHYLNYLPRVWKHLEQDLKHPILQPLKEWLDMHVPRSHRGVIGIKVTSEELAASA